MPEGEPSPETPEYSREQIVAAFKKLADRGFTHPSQLPDDDPDVIAAETMLRSWGERIERQAQQNPDPGAMIEYAVSRSTVPFDAGFYDTEYLSHLLGEWLDQDRADAEEAGLIQTAARIQAKIEEIKAKLGQ